MGANKWGGWGGMGGLGGGWEGWGGLGAGLPPFRPRLPAQRCHGDRRLPPRWGPAFSPRRLRLLRLLRRRPEPCGSRGRRGPRRCHGGTAAAALTDTDRQQAPPPRMVPSQSPRFLRSSSLPLSLHPPIAEGREARLLHEPAAPRANKKVGGVLIDALFSNKFQGDGPLPSPPVEGGHRLV